MVEGQVETKRERSSAWKIILLVVVGLFIIGSLLPEPTPEELAAREAEQARAEQAERAQQVEAAKARIGQATAVTAIELARAYDENEAAAALKFKGKLLVVSGEVAGVTLLPDGEPVVRLVGINRYSDVGVFIDDQSAAAELSKGQAVRALCESIVASAGTPALGKCVLVE